MFDNLPTVLPHIRSGKLRGLAIAGAQRARALPELPTLAESGVPGVEVNSWFALLAPAGTPDGPAAALERESAKALATSEVKARMYAMGAEATPGTAADVAKLTRTDIEKWAKLVAATGARAE
jgi:tripartite-type tricarboxylate transporter receptor subunit TctC